jgi:hypothetical protein
MFQKKREEKIRTLTSQPYGVVPHWPGILKLSPPVTNLNPS